MELTAWFRYFIAKTYPGQDIPQDQIDGLGEEFDNYLRSKFDDDHIKLWYPVSLIDIIMNSEHPFRHHGFSLPLAYHFFDYIEQQAQKALADEQDIE